MKGLIVAVLIGSCAFSQPAMCERVILFGDCMTDTAAGTRHLKGGKVWAEWIPEKFGLEFSQETNYAVSGQHTGTLPGTLEKVKPIAAGDIVIGLVGTYDCLRIVEDWVTVKSDPVAAKAKVAAIGDRVGESIERLKDASRALHGKGARRFFIATLPDLSLTPAVREHGDEGVRVAKIAVTEFNRQIGTMVEHFRLAGNHTPDVMEMKVVHVGEALDKVFADKVLKPGTPAPESKAPVPPGGVDPQAEEPLRLEDCFYDPVHPSAVVHRLVIDLIAGNQATYIR